MLQERIEARWLEAFGRVLEMCAVRRGETVAVLSETQSRPVLTHLAELAAGLSGATVCHVQVASPAQTAPVAVRSSGASRALTGQTAAVAALKAADVVLDCTVEGLLHARELPEILKAGARVLMISNEHPECLERLVPDPDMKDRAKAAIGALRAAGEMRVTSAAGSDLTVDMTDAAVAGVWGWTDRPGTIAHWPGGLVVAFPKAGAVNGRLVMAPGDANLTFKRYLDAPVPMRLENDHVVEIEGTGTDAELLRRHFAAWGDPAAYAVSHVGWGLDPRARYEAMTMYDGRQFNGTELRCVAGAFLFSTGANEFAGRFTEGHFDLPMASCDVALDGREVIAGGRLL